MAEIQRIGDSIFNSGVSGYQTTVDEPYRQKNVASESSLLSDKAEESRIALANQKLQTSLDMQVRSQLQQEIEKRQQNKHDVESTQGQLNVLQAARAKMVDPEQRQRVDKQISELSQRAAGNAVKANELRLAQQERFVGELSDLFNPSNLGGVDAMRLRGQSNIDPEEGRMQVGIAEIVQGNAPIPTGPFAGTKYPDLTNEQKKAFQTEVINSARPEGTKAALAEMRKQTEEAKIEVKKEQEKAALHLAEQKLALVRMGLDIRELDIKRKERADEHKAGVDDAKLDAAEKKAAEDKRTNEAKLEAKREKEDLALQKLRLDTHNRLTAARKVEPTELTPKENNIFSADVPATYAPNPDIARLEAQLNELDEEIKNRALGRSSLTTVSSSSVDKKIPDSSKKKLTSTEKDIVEKDLNLGDKEEAWITANIAGNPGMTREQIILAGIDTGKIKRKPETAKDKPKKSSTPSPKRGVKEIQAEINKLLKNPLASYVNKDVRLARDAQIADLVRERDAILQGDRKGKSTQDTFQGTFWMNK